MKYNAEFIICYVLNVIETLFCENGGFIIVKFPSEIIDGYDVSVDFAKLPRSI